MAQRQQDCPDLKRYFDYLEHNELPQDEKLARKTVLEAPEFCIEDGTLFRVTPQRDRALKQVDPLVKQMVIPTNLRQEVLYAYHDNNSHQGTDRLFAAIQPKYWWSNQFTDCKSYVKNCTICQQAKRHYHAKKAELQPLPVVGLFERVHLDFAGPLPKTPDGYQYILLVVDSLSRFPIAIPMKTIDAKETADALFEHVWTVFGCSKQLLTDRGQTFMSKLLARLCKLMDIHRIRTGSYKPNVNSACERMNSTIWKSLRCYVESKQDSDWIKYLQCVMAAHRATPTVGTKLSPFQVLFGQRMRMPLDVALDLPDENRATTADEYMRQMLPKLEVVRKVCQDNTIASQQQSKKYYDRNAETRQLAPGTRVWLHDPVTPKNRSSKLVKRWKGPYYTVERFGEANYWLRECGTHKRVGYPVFIDKLKLFHDDRSNFANSATITADDDEIYERIDVPAAPGTPNQDEQTLNRDEIIATAPNTVPTTPADDLTAPDAEDTVISQPTAPPPHQTAATNDVWYEAIRLRDVRGGAKNREYLVEWSEPGAAATWEKADDVSERLKELFHVNRTLTGKRRKRL